MTTDSRLVRFVLAALATLLIVSLIVTLVQ
jgi:hypothetical protein